MALQRTGRWSSSPNHFAQQISVRGFLDKVEREGERGLAIHYNKDRVNAGEVLAAVNAMGHGIVDVSTREADLEDVFLNLTRAANG